MKVILRDVHAETQCKEMLPAHFCDFTITLLSFFMFFSLLLPCGRPTQKCRKRTIVKLTKKCCQSKQMEKNKRNISFSSNLSVTVNLGVTCNNKNKKIREP